MREKPQNIASIKRSVSKSTETLITAKSELSDIHSRILDAMELVYGEEVSDRFYDEIYNSMIPLSELVDRYIIESIDCNLGTLSSTEF